MSIQNNEVIDGNLLKIELGNDAIAAQGDVLAIMELANMFNNNMLLNLLFLIGYF